MKIWTTLLNILDRLGLRFLAASILLLLALVIYFVCIKPRIYALIDDLIWWELAWERLDGTIA